VLLTIAAQLEWQTCAGALACVSVEWPLACKQTRIARQLAVIQCVL